MCPVISWLCEESRIDTAVTRSSYPPPLKTGSWKMFLTGWRYKSLYFVSLLAHSLAIHCVQVTSSLLANIYLHCKSFFPPKSQLQHFERKMSCYKRLINPKLEMSVKLISRIEEGGTPSHPVSRCSSWVPGETEVLSGRKLHRENCNELLGLGKLLLRAILQSSQHF